MPRLVVSPDGLSAHLELAAREHLTLEELLPLLAAERIPTAGCEEALGALLTQAGPARIPLFTGTEPIPGEPGRIEYTFRTGREGLQPVIGPDGRADYRNLGLVVVVEPGQVLARRVPPTAGTPGRSVRGEAIPARSGRDVRLRAGTGAAVDGDTIVATQAGHPHLSGEVVMVRQEYVLAADVTLSTGNLEFDGDLLILGNVEIGMRVRATGHVRIGGYVEGAVVMGGGAVTIEGGVRHQAQVQAGTDLVARFAENSTLTAGASLVIHEDLIHCQARSGGELVVGGQLIGGEATALARVEARTLGARMGVPTRVTALAQPPEVLEALHRLEAERSEVQARLAVISPRVREAQAALAQHQPGIDVEVFRQVLQASAQLALHDQDLADQAAELRRQLSAISPRIEVKDTIQPGVTLQVGQAFLRAQTPAPSGIFVDRGGAMVRLPR